MALLYCGSIEKGLAKWFRVEWRGGGDISFRQEEEEEWGKPSPLSPFLKATVREKDWWVAEWKNMGLAALSWWRCWGGEGSEEALSREILFLELQKCHLEKLFLFQERAQSIPPRIFFIRTDGRGRRKKKLIFSHIRLASLRRHYIIYTNQQCFFGKNLLVQ